MKGFSLGSIVATPGALAAATASGETLLPYLARHAKCDWGDVDNNDAAENDRALIEGTRLLSVYTLKNGAKIWVITEADRASTCVLLPSEY